MGAGLLLDAILPARRSLSLFPFLLLLALLGSASAPGGLRSERKGGGAETHNSRVECVAAHLLFVWRVLLCAMQIPRRRTRRDRLLCIRCALVRARWRASVPAPTCVCGQLVSDVTGLLGLTDGMFVKVVRNMTLSTLRTKGVADAVLAPLEDFDEGAAAESIDGAKKVGLRLLTKKFDGGFPLLLKAFLGLTDDVMTSMVRSSAIGLFRAQGVKEEILGQIETAQAEGKIEAATGQLMARPRRRCLWPLCTRQPESRTLRRMPWLRALTRLEYAADAPTDQAPFLICPHGTLRRRARAGRLHEDPQGRARRGDDGGPPRCVPLV